MDVDFERKEYAMGNGNQYERILKIFVSIGKSVLNKKIDPEIVAYELQEILERGKCNSLLGRTVDGNRITGVGKSVKGYSGGVFFCSVVFSDNTFGVVVHHRPTNTLKMPAGPLADKLLDAKGMIVWEFDEGNWIAWIDANTGYIFTDLPQYHDRSLPTTWNYQCCGVSHSGTRAIVEAAKHGVTYSADIVQHH